MRGAKPSLGNNASLVRIFYGRFLANGAAAPAGWTQGGQGLVIPTYPATGTFAVVVKDPPGGVLLDWHVSMRCDAIANSMVCVPGTWDSTTNTFKFFTATPAAPTTLADPPAAHADREFTIRLVFSQQENH